MHKAYFGEAGSQIHFRVQSARNNSGIPPLILLPPAPHSGLYYKNVIDGLSHDRDVYAVDYPGYGGSDPLPGTPSIEDYAGALKAFLDQFEAYLLMGFHTGCLIAVELTLQMGAKGKILLVDVPYLSPEQQKAMGAKFEKPAPVPQTVTDLKASFDMQVTNRLNDLPLARGVELWVETLRAGQGLNAAFAAAFRYPCVEKFSAVNAQIHVLSTASPLKSATDAAATALPDATLIDLPQIAAAVFEKYADDITAAINSVLGHD